MTIKRSMFNGACAGAVGGAVGGVLSIRVAVYLLNLQNPTQTLLIFTLLSTAVGILRAVRPMGFAFVFFISLAVTGIPFILALLMNPAPLLDYITTQPLNILMRFAIFFLLPLPSLITAYLISGLVIRDDNRPVALQQ